MNYGLYLSAGGTMRGLHRMDVITNNLANINTVGFKPDAVYTRQRLPERLESPGLDVDPRQMLEQLGGGVHGMPTRVQLIQGQLDSTGNPLDLAISGRGFLVVQQTDEDGSAALRLTRDGRLTHDETGLLQHADTRLPVLDVRGRPIRLADRGQVEIDLDGVVRQGGTEVGRLRLVNTDASNLIKMGANLMRLRDESAAATQPADGAIHQGFVETSAVDPVLALTDLIEASKSIESNARMMQYHDHIIGQAVNTFGRVA